MTPGRALLAWYRTEHRPLPWRGEHDPYRIWLSEVMLQQTQVETVIPYYQRFLAALPTVDHLAAAELEQVLALWQGLGYYGRARNLHQAARCLAARGWPTDAAGLRALPGCGEYTAAAVASLAFGQPIAAVDGNAVRVISRLYAVAGDPSRNPARAEIRRHAAELMVAEAPGELNQAVMELGAVICRPTTPDCGRCPVAGWCAAAAAGEPTRYPERLPRAAPRRRLHACAVICRDGLVLLARRPPRGRWGGLWELPRVELEPGTEVVAALVECCRRAVGLEVTVGERLAALRHAVSGESIELVAYACRATGEPAALGYDAVTWSLGSDGLPAATPQRRMWRALLPRLEERAEGADDRHDDADHER